MPPGQKVSHPTKKTVCCRWSQESMRDRERGHRCHSSPHETNQNEATTAEPRPLQLATGKGHRETTYTEQYAR